MIFTKENVIPSSSRAYAGHLSDYKEENIIKYGKNIEISLWAWHVLNTSLCFYSPVASTKIYYFVSRSEFPCLGKAIEREKLNGNKNYDFIPLLELFSESQMLIEPT